MVLDGLEIVAMAVIAVAGIWATVRMVWILSVHVAANIGAWVWYPSNREHRQELRHNIIRYLSDV